MRWRPVRAQRSVDRGTYRPDIEPRNQRVWGADAVVVSGRQYRWRRYRELSGDPARSENPSMYGVLVRENRDIRCSSTPLIMVWTAQGTLRRYA